MIAFNSPEEQPVAPGSGLTFAKLEKIYGMLKKDQAEQEEKQKLCNHVFMLHDLGSIKYHSCWKCGKIE